MRHRTRGTLVLLQLVVGLTVVTAGGAARQLAPLGGAGTAVLQPQSHAGAGERYRVHVALLGHLQQEAGDSVLVAVDVTNTGSLPGDAVAQLYIHQRSGSASRPVRQLEGFRRVTLQPGATTTLRFSLGRGELQFWSPQTKRWVVEPSVFDVWVGEDSGADLHAELTIES